MRKLLLVAAAAVCVGSPAFATTGPVTDQGQSVQNGIFQTGVVQMDSDSFVLVAANEGKGKGNGNGNGNGTVTVTVTVTVTATDATTNPMKKFQR